MRGLEEKVPVSERGDGMVVASLLMLYLKFSEEKEWIEELKSSDFPIRYGSVNLSDTVARWCQRQRQEEYY
jgi:hypothetical protein